MLIAIGYAVAAEHIRHFQLRAIHWARRSEVLRRNRLGFNGNRVWKEVERAGGGAYFGGCDPQIPSGGCKAAVTKKQLISPDVGPRFQQMNGKSVAKRMRCNRFADSREASSLLTGEFNRAGTDGLAGDVTLEQPPLRPHGTPVTAECL